MDDQTEIFRHWLRKIIKKDKRITGKQLAALVGCDPSTISSYIRMRTRPDYGIQETIQNKLGVTDQEVTEQGKAEIKNLQQTVLVQPQPETLPTGTRRSAIEFNNRATADEIMTALKEIEKLDPGELEFFRSIILNRLDYLRGTDHSR